MKQARPLKHVNQTRMVMEESINGAAQAVANRPHHTSASNASTSAQPCHHFSIPLQIRCRAQ